MSKPGRTVRVYLALIIGLQILISLLYVVVTPIGEGPDELDHIRYVEHLVRFGSFAPISGGDGAFPYTLEAKQPPGYYLLNAGLMLALGRGGRALAPDLEQNPDFGEGSDGATWYVHPPVPLDLLLWTYIMRFVGVLMAVGTVILTFLTAREVFPSADRAPLALCAAALVALLPQFNFMSAVVNNDNFAILVGAGLSYWIVRCVRRGPNVRFAAVLGVLLGLALLSKLNTMLYVPVALLALVLPVDLPAGTEVPLTSSQPSRVFTLAIRFAQRRLVLVLIAVAISMLIAGWWYARNLQLYGDLFAFGAVNRMAAEAVPTHVVSFDPSAPGAWLTQLLTVMSTHYGAFGWVVIKPPAVLYLLYVTLLLLAALGFVAAFIRRRLTGTQLAQLALAGLIIALIYGSMVYNGVGQGRLLYPTLALTSLFVATGTHGLLGILTRRNSERANAIASAVFWTLFLGLSGIYCLFWLVIPSFN